MFVSSSASMLVCRLIEKAQLTLSDSELNMKAKQYDSIIDDVIKGGTTTKSQAPSSPFLVDAGDSTAVSLEPSMFLLF